MQLRFTAVILLTCLSVVCSAELSSDWNQAFEQAVQAQTTPPALAARNAAILHIALHDAYQIAQDDPAFPPILVDAALGRKHSAANPVLAANAAARSVFRVLFPSEFVTIKVDAPGEIDDVVRRESLLLGMSVAEAVLAARQNDGASTTIHYVPRSGKGEWRRTTRNRPPELPHWPLVQPFALERANQFRPDAPPNAADPVFQRDLDEVKQLGGTKSKTRTPEQTEIAKFWSDFSYTSTPPGHWNQIARGIADQQGLDLPARIRLFAVLNIVLADAGLAAFDCKYHYNFWRPVTALQSADTTSTWNSLLPAPSHPEYVSAHSTFSAGAATVLDTAFPGLKKPFEVSSDTLPGVKRSFDSFLACETEVGISRIYGGIHYSFSNLAGHRLGRDLAGWILERLPIR